MQPITRRTLTISTAAASLAGLSAATAQQPGQPSAKPPNIVFFLADDLGYADLSCYGRPDISTPNIDRIATGGVRFLQGYANSAVCSATRTALITGRCQYRLRIGLEEPISGQLNVGLPPEVPTLPSRLKALGYGTSLIGKGHLGSLPDFNPLKSGYDHFFGFRNGALDYCLHQGTDHKDDLWDGDTPVHQAGYMTDLIGDRAVDAVSAYVKAHTPFFLDVHFNAPHWPWEAIGDEAEAERLRRASLLDYDGGTQRSYREMIQRMDMQVGRVLQALDDTGLAENTIVVFTSDNGASVSPTPGRSPGARRSCWKAACASRRCCAGRRGCRRGGSRSRSPSAWIGCRPCSPPRAAARTRPFPATAWTCCRGWCRTRRPRRGSCSGATRPTSSARRGMGI